MYNNILIIHGGYGENNKIIKTLHIINIQSLVNNNPLIVTIDSGESIAQHKMVSTYEIDMNQRAHLTNNDGIITFGGSNNNGLIDNNLRIIRFYPYNASEIKNIRLKKW